MNNTELLAHTVERHNEILECIYDTMAALDKFQALLDKACLGNKSACKQARVYSVELARIFKTFRTVSVVPREIKPKQQGDSHERATKTGNSSKAQSPRKASDATKTRRSHKPRKDALRA